MTEIVGHPGADAVPRRLVWQRGLPRRLHRGRIRARRPRRPSSSARSCGEGYRGYFELDFLTDLDNDKVYLGEMNPRITGASSMTNLAAFAHADAPLFLFHLLEWSASDFELDVAELNERWSRPKNIDSWSQIVIKYTADDVERVRGRPRAASGG